MEDILCVIVSLILCLITGIGIGFHFGYLFALKYLRGKTKVEEWENCGIGKDGL